MTTLVRLQDILMKDYPLKREALTPQAQLADLDIDSLGVMELLFSIEDEFGLDVPNDKQDLKTSATWWRISTAWRRSSMRTAARMLRIRTLPATARMATIATMG